MLIFLYLLETNVVTIVIRLVTIWPKDMSPACVAIELSTNIKAPINFKEAHNSYIWYDDKCIFVCVHDSIYKFVYVGYKIMITHSNTLFI